MQNSQWLFETFTELKNQTTKALNEHDSDYWNSKFSWLDDVIIVSAAKPFRKLATAAVLGLPALLIAMLLINNAKDHALFANSGVFLAFYLVAFVVAFLVTFAFKDQSEMRRRSSTKFVPYPAQPRVSFSVGKKLVFALQDERGFREIWSTAMPELDAQESQMLNDFLLERKNLIEQKIASKRNPVAKEYHRKSKYYYRNEAVAL